MVVTCEEVWGEISNYLEGDVDPALNAALEEHFRGCRRCTAVLDGTRNVVQLYGDERMCEVPLGFSHRLHRRLEEDMSSSRRGFLGWMVAAAATILVAGGFEILRSSGFSTPQLRSQHAQPGRGVPPNLIVAVPGEGKLFHLPTCALIPRQAIVRMIAAREAEREGYTPCTRCLKPYLRSG
jgi:hypothetical protein